MHVLEALDMPDPTSAMRELLLRSLNGGGDEEDGGSEGGSVAASVAAAAPSAEEMSEEKKRKLREAIQTIQEALGEL